ncbi:MAG: hypothetical protein NZL94_06675, partial [Meiothermus sp.]|nr:hypothetical protein [Meiothermus sp.]
RRYRLKRLFVPLVVLLALAPPGLAQGSLTLSQSLEALPRTLDWQSADQTYESAVRQGWHQPGFCRTSTMPPDLQVG